jgi:ABC-type Na+ transport system ATPase subunit NatA
MLVVENLVKQYADFLAVENISFEAKKCARNAVARETPL